MKFTLLLTLFASLSCQMSVLALPQRSGSGGGRGEVEANHLLERAESHSVQINNRCGSGRGVFLYQNNSTPQGSTTINGPLKGGVAWIDGFPGANCLSSGVNCNTVEFTLINPGSDGANTHNAINYSLQSQGNHQWRYPMHFAYTKGCGAAPGPCTSATNCPGAYVGSDTTSGTPVVCQGYDEGIVITFC